MKDYIFEALTVIFVIGIVAFAIYTTVFAPCDSAYMGIVSAKDVPARCLNYLQR